METSVGGKFRSPSKHLIAPAIIICTEKGVDGRFGRVKEKYIDSDM